jgi:hypothetical protein
MSTSDELRAQAAALLTKAAELETPLSQDDVHTMFKNRQYEAIEQARRDNRIDYTIATNPEGN